jgi:hypothetical protein
MREAFVAALTLAGLTFSALAFATPVTWHMTGEVTTGNQGDFFFPFQVNAGDPIAFDFTFDAARACTRCDDTLRTYDNPLTAFTLTVGNAVFAVPLDFSSTIGLKNDWASPAGFFIDSFGLGFEGFDPAGIFFTSDLDVQITSPTVPVSGINDVRLENLLPPDSSTFTDPSLSFFSFGASFDRAFDGFGGRFLTSSVVSVPEPSALALLVPGMMVAWLVRGGASRGPSRGRAKSAAAGC